MSQVYYLAIPTILVDYGASKKRFEFGEVLADVPPDTLSCMIRLGQAVTVNPVVIEPEKTVPPNPPVTPLVPDWKLTPMADLDLSKHIQDSLADAELVTISDVLAYGAENDGSLVSLTGIGEASEKMIQDAITARAPK